MGNTNYLKKTCAVTTYWHRLRIQIDHQPVVLRHSVQDVSAGPKVVAHAHARANANLVLPLFEKERERENIDFNLCNLGNCCSGVTSPGMTSAFDPATSMPAYRQARYKDSYKI